MINMRLHNSLQCVLDRLYDEHEITQISTRRVLDRLYDKHEITQLSTVCAVQAV